MAVQTKSKWDEFLTISSVGDFNQTTSENMETSMFLFRFKNKRDILKLETSMYRDVYSPG